MSGSSKGALFVMERKLGARGHYQTLLGAIASLTTQPFSAIAAEGARAAFKTECFNILTHADACEEEPMQTAERDAAALGDLIAGQNSDGREPAILVPSATHHELAFSAALLQREDLQWRMGLRVLAIGQIKDLSPDLIATLRDGIAKGQIRFFAETIDFQQHFETEIGLPVAGLLSLPCNHILYDQLDAPSVRRAPDRLRILFPGAGRREKGLDQYPEIFRAVARTDLGVGSVEFAFQNPRRHRALRRYIKLIAAYQAMRSRFSNQPLRFDILPVSLDDAGYAEQMQRADIVMLPYDGERYFRRGSGAVIDAVSAGCGIIYASGMGYSELLSHGNAAPIDGPDDVPDAIRQLGRLDQAHALKARSALEALYREAGENIEGLLQGRCSDAN